ncbi:uncharacterized protein [Cicer arietinum]|uniref:Uncharacterized protein LOC101499726 isoform X2 n=1 Tax=Cicer arietinum TaxID=3827 RepID=A0A1S2XFF7_CICAR|nr:uncharacterized protein LOC101499726 isoform X2 [Cicer arietinum]
MEDSLTGYEDGWSEEATFTLIDAWGERYVKLNRSNLRKKHWKEIAKAVNDRHNHVKKARRTNVQCKNRIDALKKKYKIEKARVSESGDYADYWPFFDVLDSLIGDTFPAKNLSPVIVPPVKVPTWTPPMKAPAWALAPVGPRSRSQKRPAPVTTTSASLESLEEEEEGEDSCFRRNLSAFAAAVAEAAESEIESSDGLINESKKLKRGINEMEFGGIEKFGEIYERVEEEKQREMVELEKQKMQSAKDLEYQSKTTKRSKNMNDPSVPSQSELNAQSTQKNVRRATLLKEFLALNRIAGQRISVEFDQSTGMPSGENKTKFKSHVAFLGRSEVSILIDEWDSVDENVKNQIWATILKIWDILNSEFLKKKWISYAGERWRAFKTCLTSRYIHGDLCNKSPLEVYDFLDEETWQAFIQKRKDPSFLDKRKKAQMVQVYNKCPHRLSRGGYELLKKRMMQEKLKQSKESSVDLVAAPPSPLSRHEMWKRARQRPSGDYTSEDTRKIAEKIDSLVEQTTQGTFVPQGRKDILTEAIGQPEHPGRVRGVGQGVGIRQYFGPHSRNSTTPVLSNEQIKTMKVELTQQIKEQLMQDLTTMGFSKLYPKVSTCSPNATVHTSTKGSCSVVTPTLEEDDIPERCELYVDNFLHVVAYGNAYKIGPTIHNQILDNDMVKVVVDEVLDANVQVPMPTDEVKTVGQAPNNFIQWPKRFIRIVSDKDVDGSKKADVSPKRSEPQLDSVQQLVLKAMNMSGSIRLDLEHDETDIFWLSQRDIIELCMGKQELCITILQLWLTYLHRLCIDVGKNDLYGFIDPYFIKSQLDPTNAQTYLQKKLFEDKRECYLAPYHNNCHWQLLIICPRKNTVVFLCSLGRKPEKDIIHIVDSALGECNKLQGIRKKPIWFVPDIFGNLKSFHDDELKNVRQCCASLILEYIQTIENA